MANDSTPTQKAFALYAHLFFNNQPYTLGSLAELLDTSKATVTRLISQIEATGFGIIRQGRQGKEVTYRFEPVKAISRLRVNARGLYLLALGKNFLSNLLPSGQLRDMEECLSQISQCLPKNMKLPSDSPGRPISKGRVDYGPYEKIIDTLLLAIDKSYLCAIDYQSGTGSKKRHILKPRCLAAYKDTLYVEGSLLIQHGSSVKLPVQRIAHCEIIRKEETATKGDSIARDGSFGIMSGNGFEATIRFSQRVAMYVAERKWSDGQTIEKLADGGVILTARMANLDECVAWLLSFGPWCQAMDPPELVEAMRKDLEAMLAIYNKC